MTRTVAALAGRRVDAPHSAAARFPVSNIPLVRRRILEQFERLAVQALVCSAACGADLLALDVAGDLGIRRRAVLPSDPSHFRQTSVIDRPGDWGPLFDRIVTDLQRSSALATFRPAGDDAEGYREANARILDDAEQAGRDLGLEVIAIVVWDSRSRGEDDLTEAFARDAAQRGHRVVEVSTLATSAEK